MRISQLLGTTLRESAQEIEFVSHELLLRAGYIRQLGAGIFSFLHLGNRSMQKINQILREELERIGGVEVSLPFVHPADFWKKTNRWYEIDDSLARFQDRGGRDMVLAMTHEEVVAELARTEISSYKQLPKLIYQIQDKFRDEVRSRGGLIRVREFTMKDSYSLDKDYEALEKQYINHYDAYFRIMARVNLPVMAIQSDVGMMGGKMAHEFMYIKPIGEDTIFVNEKAGYQANKEVATFKKNYEKREEKPLEKIHTPDTKSIASLAEFLKLPQTALAKIVFYMGKVGDDESEKLIFAMVRGDLEVNPVKLQKVANIKTLRSAQESEIKAVGAIPGFASPINIQKENALVVVDDWVAKMNNWVVGANETDYHYLNACIKRDFEADFVGDITSAFEGAIAPNAPEVSEEYALKAVRGVEVGNIFQLGTKYTDGMGAKFTNENGKEQSIIMGSYGIGVGRLLACLVEEYNDEKGFYLPISVAPYQVHFVALLDNAEIKTQAEEIYNTLKTAGVEILYDDRAKKTASPGVKFSDAELMGMPLQITLSKRSLKNGGVELIERKTGQSQIISIENLTKTVQEKIQELFNEIDTQLSKAETWEKRKTL